MTQLSFRERVQLTRLERLVGEARTELNQLYTEYIDEQNRLTEQREREARAEAEERAARTEAIQQALRDGRLTPRNWS